MPGSQLPGEVSIRKDMILKFSPTGINAVATTADESPLEERRALNCVSLFIQLGICQKLPTAYSR